MGRFYLWVFERWSSYLRCHLQDGGVVAVEMGDPVVCTLVLVRDISLSLSCSLSGPLFWVKFGICYRQRTSRHSKSSKHVCIVNIFNGFPLLCFWLTAPAVLSVADLS